MDIDVCLKMITTTLDYNWNKHRHAFIYLLDPDHSENPESWLALEDAYVGDD